MTPSDARGRTINGLKALSDEEIAALLAQGAPPLDAKVLKDLETTPWTPSDEELVYTDEDLANLSTDALRAPARGRLLRIGAGRGAARLRPLAGTDAPPGDADPRGIRVPHPSCCPRPLLGRGLGHAEGLMPNEPDYLPANQDRAALFFQLIKARHTPHGADRGQRFRGMENRARRLGGAPA